MFPKSFSNFTFYQKKNDILIYKAADSNQSVYFKVQREYYPCAKTGTP